MPLFLRKWATPLIIGSFLIMGVSGTLMFFHINLGLLKVIHEWAGWAMLVGAIAHVVINWRAFACYFKRPMALSIMGVCTLALLVGMALPSNETKGQGPGQMIAALSGASMEKIAILTDKSLKDLQSDLATAGYTNAKADDTVVSLAGNNRGAQLALLNAALN